MPSVFVSNSKNSNCEVPVANTTRQRPDLAIAFRIEFDACSAAAPARAVESWNTLKSMGRIGGMIPANYTSGVRANFSRSESRVLESRSLEPGRQSLHE